MKLSELIKNVDILTSYTDAEISDVTDDSRKVKDGSAFVCVKGEHFDGNNFAIQALEHGARAIITERDLGLKEQVIVKDAAEAYSKMCSEYFGNSAEKMQFIGVTGTNGKTTTTFLIKEMLEKTGLKAGLVGTIRNIAGEKSWPSSLTTPDSYELNRLFSEMVKEGCKYCVMEVSSQALAQKRVAGIHFNIAVFTNLTQDHLDYHGTIENYFAAKHILFENADTAIINLDSRYAEEMVKDTDCKVISYSIKKDISDYTAKNIKYKGAKAEYELVGKNVIGRVHINIPGEFSIYNSMAAAVCAITAGIPFDNVLSALKGLKGVEGRAEVVPTDTDYTVIIDYAHSPDGLENIIRALKVGVQGRLITVFGCGGDRDKTKRPQMGKIAQELSDFVVITSDNPRTEEPEDIIKDILEGINAKKKNFEVVIDRTQAVNYALSIAQDGDIVLLAGKGHETYQVLKEGKIHFDEREVVRGFLNNNMTEE